MPLISTLFPSMTGSEGTLLCNAMYLTEVYQDFRGRCCLCLKGGHVYKIAEKRDEPYQLLHCDHLWSTKSFYRLHHISDDHSLHSHCQISDMKGSLTTISCICHLHDYWIPQIYEALACKYSAICIVPKDLKVSYSLFSKTWKWPTINLL